MQLNAIERKIEALEKLIDRNFSNLDITVLEVEEIIAICDNVINLIKQEITSNGFYSHEEEEYFFKYLKPRLCSHFIFFIKVRAIKLRIPALTSSRIKRFFKEEIHKIDHFFSNNSEVLTYYNSHATHLDSLYFRKSEDNIKIGIEYRSSDVDKSFCSPKGFIIAKYVANTKLAKFIDTFQSYLLNNSCTDFSIPTNKLSWTKSNVDLVELIYALKLTGAIPENIKEISSVFEQVFEVDLSNISRTWVDIKNRKIIKAKFLSESLQYFNKNIENLYD